MYYLKQLLRFIGGAFLLIIALYNPINTFIEKRTTHTEVTATITSVGVSTSRYKGRGALRYSYTPTYSFTANNQTYTKHDNVYRSDSELKVGETIDIVYEKADPDKSHVSAGGGPMSLT
jgi:Protein of unknown function (DUF3592)